MRTKKETLDILNKMRTYGPMSSGEFKDLFPRITSPSRTIYSLCANGFVRRFDNLLTVTDKSRELLPRTKPVVLSVALPRRVEHTGTYTGQRFTPMRPGAEDHLQIPSLMAGLRVYRKGAGRA